jgi:hypothetical protein
MLRKTVKSRGGDPRKPVPEVKLLLEMAAKAGLSRYGLAKVSQVDDRYLARLEAGEADNPGREILLRLAMALVHHTSLFKRADVEKVLAAAGEPPSPDYIWAERVYVAVDDGSYRSPALLHGWRR